MSTARSSPQNAGADCAPPEQAQGAANVGRASHWPFEKAARGACETGASFSEQGTPVQCHNLTSPPSSPSHRKIHGYKTTFTNNTRKRSPTSPSTRSRVQPQCPSPTLLFPFFLIRRAFNFDKRATGKNRLSSHSMHKQKQAPYDRAHGTEKQSSTSRGNNACTTTTGSDLFFYIAGGAKWPFRTEPAAAASSAWWRGGHCGSDSSTSAPRYWQMAGASARQ